MDRENRNLLTEGAKGLGIDLDGKTLEAFDLYLRELIKWNQKINLTAIRTEKGIILKHFLDSLSVSPYLSNLTSLLDVGSGAGFPGIPLKMVHPSLNITLIDSVRKKVDFQRHIIRTLHLKGIEAIHGRVQDQGLLQKMEGQFDGVLSRAFSDLTTLLRLSFPFLKPGGRVIAMKGKEIREEIQPLSDAEGAPFRLRKTITLFLPSTTLKRSIIVFEKK